MNSAYGPPDPSQHAGMDSARPFANPNLSRLSSGSPPTLPPYGSIHPPHHTYQHQQQYQPPPPPPLPHSVLQQQLPPHHHHQHQNQHQHQHQQQHQHRLQQEPPLEPQHSHPHPPSIHQHAPHQHQPQSTYSRDPSPPPTDLNKEKDSAAPQQPVMVSRSGEANGRRYSLDVVQQPKRARMCGYGDKDRRPITPPPCVRLIIIDIATGKEVNYKEIDHTMFVLNVDLWNEQGAQEVNLCRQPASTSAPSLSSSSYSYATGGGDPPPPPGPAPMLASGRETHFPPPPGVGYLQDYAQHQQQQQHQQQHQQQLHHPYGHAPSYSQNGGGAYGSSQPYYSHDNPYQPNPSVMPISSQRYDGGAPSMGYTDGNGPSVAYVHDQYKGALNRNLIGSVAASAFCLVDTSDKDGIWFVLQDLSVRLEGSYRLKFSFVNVGMATGPSRDRGTSTVVKGKAPILAWCFSDSFNVYSAKKFPGVCESTALSKTFATQGIKIPIRKDGNKGGDDDDMD